MPQIKANKLLRVAIFGRPNVGKSTLFNQLTGTRRAIVKDQPGVTRDVQRGLVEWCGHTFEIFDTAGVTEGGTEIWSEEIKIKALEAMKTADKVLFILDGKYGLNPEDKDLRRLLNKVKIPVLAIVNKIDEFENFEMGLSEFFELDLENMIAASFEHKIGVDIILDWVVSDQVIAEHVEDDKQVRIGVVGKPNAGKSTLVNRILGENRVVVSAKAGTTVDSVEIPFTRGDLDYLLVDTAGLRRHAKRSDEVELISAFKAQESVATSHILLVVVDGTIGPSVQDSRIIELALEHHVAVILVVNKIDLAERNTPKFREQFREKIDNTFHFFRDIPVAFISAKNGKGVDELFKQVERVWKQLNIKISTRDINEFFFKAIREAPSPSYRGNDIKFYYITQTRQRPPSFMAFVNEPKGVTNSYRRFVASKIKKHYDLVGIPIRIFPKKRARRPRGEAKIIEQEIGEVIS